MKIIYFIILVLLTSCAKTYRYIYYSDLPHQKGKEILVIKNDSVCSINCLMPEIKNCDCDFVKISKERYEFLEMQRVVKLDSIFYIRNNVQSKRIYKKYTNRVLNF